VAFVVVNTSVNTSDLKKYLKAVLPEYMVPSVFVKMDRIPLTSNGKIDKKALLKKLSAMVQVEESYSEPTTATEKQLAEIWKEILGIDKVGINDRFFDAGGHSLLLIRSNQKIKDQFNIDLPFRLYFNHTLAQIAKEINVKTAPTEIAPAAV
jgi:acyl carrier protein